MEHVYINSVSLDQSEGLIENLDVYHKLLAVYIIQRDYEITGSDWISSFIYIKFLSHTAFISGSVPGAEDKLVTKTETHSGCVAKWIERQPVKGR